MKKKEIKFVEYCRTCENVRQDKNGCLYCIAKSDTRNNEYFYVGLNYGCNKHELDKKIIAE